MRSSQQPVSWNRRRREHVLNDVPIHTITPEDAQEIVGETCVIDGVLVASLRDLIAIKLRCGLSKPACTKQIGELPKKLIRTWTLAPLPAKLPADLRPEFKKLVDAVRAAKKGAREGKRPL